MAQISICVYTIINSLFTLLVYSLMVVTLQLPKRAAATYNCYITAVHCWIVFFCYAYKVVKFVVGSIGLDSFLPIEGGILIDKEVTSLIIIGGPDWFWTPMIGNNAPNYMLKSRWFSHKTKFSHIARNTHF